MKSDSLMIPCCYFPTKIVMIDDNAALSESLKFHLEAETQIFEHPQKAYNFLKAYEPQITENTWLLTENESDLADGSYAQPMVIDTAKIRSIQHNPDKDQDISVLIVDYHMPELNGLELLAKLSDKPFKTILLTGESNHELAISAFNQGQIDYFLRKDEDDLPEKLNQIIKQLQLKYFIDMSRKSIQILALHNPIFSDKKISEYFYRQIKQHHIAEFYLINLYGNYLLLNHQHQKQYFCAYTQEQLNIFAEYGIEDNADSEIIQYLKQAQKIPFFGENTPYWKIRATEWEDFLYEPNRIQTNSNTFFVMVKT